MLFLWVIFVFFTRLHLTLGNWPFWVFRRIHFLMRVQICILKLPFTLPHVPSSSLSLSSFLPALPPSSLSVSSLIILTDPLEPVRRAQVQPPGSTAGEGSSVRGSQPGGAATVPHAHVSRTNFEGQLCLFPLLNVPCVSVAVPQTLTRRLSLCINKPCEGRSHRPAATARPGRLILATQDTLLGLIFSGPPACSPSALPQLRADYWSTSWRIKKCVM